VIKALYRKLRNASLRYFDLPTKKAMSLLPNKGIVTLGDVGAAGEIEPRWRPYTKSLKYIGFEPDKRSRDTIANLKSDFLDYKIVPYALSDSTKTATLNLCRKPQVSSLYEPNVHFLNRFPDATRFDVLEKLDFRCVTLDSIELDELDFLKIDIQGAGNDVLKGANSSLELVLGLELEVEFVELYIKQPLFGDVCQQLFSKGFEFIDFVNLARWERDEHNGYGQCIFGDALFLKTPEFLETQSLGVDKVSTYITILMIYRRFDLVQVCLDSLSKEKRSQFELFERTFDRVKSRDAIVRRIASMMNRLISFVGSNYRLHLLQ